MKLFDAHCHLQDPRISHKAPQLIATTVNSGVLHFAVNGVSEVSAHGFSSLLFFFFLRFRAAGGCWWWALMGLRYNLFLIIHFMNYFLVIAGRLELG